MDREKEQYKVGKNNSLKENFDDIKKKLEELVKEEDTCGRTQKWIDTFETVKCSLIDKLTEAVGKNNKRLTERKQWYRNHKNPSSFLTSLYSNFQIHHEYLKYFRGERADIPFDYSQYQS